ncbi:NADPH-dependent FMN reductase [candidate division KSB1 bacterium]
MYKIALIIGSTREGRQSQKAAYYINSKLNEYENVETTLIDLQDYEFPMFTKNLKLHDDPDGKLNEFSDILRASDSVIIVTPEYNGGYPAVIKNALDHIGEEIRNKPVGVVTTSSGGFGGTSVLAQLRVVLLHMGALPIPAKLPVSHIQTVFGDSGDLLDGSYEKKTANFLNGLLWYTEAIAEQKKRS